MSDSSTDYFSKEFPAIEIFQKKIQKFTKNFYFY